MPSLFPRALPKKRSASLMTLLLLVLLQACASLDPNLEKPTIKLDSLALAESTGISQRFKIGLLITNPNAVALPVTGMTYTLGLNGFDVISGANNKIPTLEAYSETPVVIDASADLVAALRLLNSLSRRPQDTLQYEFGAKIDLAGWRPSFNIVEDGVVELSQPR